MSAKQLTLPIGSYRAKEFKLVCLQETPMGTPLLDNAAAAAAYWRETLTGHPYLNPEVECLVVLVLNTRRRVKGHFVISIGLMDTLLIHAREVFRPAIVASAQAILLMHNHPSGDPTPSEADIRATRDMIRAGQLLKIELLDHVIIGKPEGGRPGFCSLKELGHFYA